MIGGVWRLGQTVAAWPPGPHRHPILWPLIGGYCCAAVVLVVFALGFGYAVAELICESRQHSSIVPRKIP